MYHTTAILLAFGFHMDCAWEYIRAAEGVREEVDYVCL